MVIAQSYKACAILKGMNMGEHDWKLLNFSLKNYANYSKALLHSKATPNQFKSYTNHSKATPLFKEIQKTATTFIIINFSSY